MEQFSNIFQRIQSIQNRIHNIRPQRVKHFERFGIQKSFGQHLQQELGVQRSFSGQSFSPASIPQTQKPNSFSALERTSLPERRQLFPSKSKTAINHIVSQASANYRIPETLVHAVIKAESAYNPRAVSHAGAKGLMQLMPQTATELGVTDVFDPKENIFAGTRYLRKLLDYFQGNLPLSLAAYNSGIQRVVNAQGIPKIQETQNYVKQVIHHYQKMNQARL